jgi:Rad3-related DNA helicase
MATLPPPVAPGRPPARLAANPDPPDEPRYTVAVRELCQCAAKTGDLDLRFTPAPTAQEGVAGHQLVASRRGPGWRAEVALSGQYRGLRLRGRADGLDASAQRLEEIKTFKGDLARQPANHRALHWAQAKLYGWLYCQASGAAELDICLVYLDVHSQRETVFTERCTHQALATFGQALCARFLAWAQAELAHRQQRNAGLTALPFVYPQMHAGQRQLAENVYRAARLGRCLLAQAPTGIGKTLGTLYPMLKACAQGQVDKVYFLSAKGSGKALALQALGQLRQHAGGGALRVLELVARDTACVHPDRSCHGDDCPRAQGFYDRLPAARSAAVAPGPAGATQLLDGAAVQALASTHGVCPYYLAQDLVRWSDVVVADYNHYFDQSALLHGLAQANDWRVGVLVDEAHNLIERGRAMYSATLDPLVFAQLRRSAPSTLKRPLDRLHRAWRALAAGLGDGEAAQAPVPPAGDTRLSDSVPAAWLDALRGVNAAIGELLAEPPAVAGRGSAEAAKGGASSEGNSKAASPPSAYQLSDQPPDQPPDPRNHQHLPSVHPQLLPFYFESLQFERLADSFDSHSLFELSVRKLTHKERGQPGCRPAIRNLVPASFLAPRFAASRCTVLFSATLSPPQFYADVLGLPESTAVLSVGSPFAPGQLQVQVAAHLSTRFQDRRRTLAPLVDLIARQFTQAPGNYLAFFSSFDYLAQAQACLAERHPGLAQWAQSRQMDEPARQAFLARFGSGGQGGIGLAVLGGLFAEGIDLPGQRLIGAFVATLGLPQHNPLNEALRQRLQQQFGRGHDYAYLYPGLRKVVQAAGRVIRGADDRGWLWLIDDRFARPEVRSLLPDWWQLAPAAGPTQVPALDQC